jgi:peptidyl-prolyl cis-trans isomerase SurA
MNKLTFFLVGLITSCSSLGIIKSPQNSTLLTVADEPVLSEEFIYAFNKNRPADSLVSKANIDDYLDLYVKFKLKVTEAKSRGMDTTNAFRKEYSSYIDQLDNSYLQSSNETDALVNEAYERMQFEIRASHILFGVTEADSPGDTLTAYKKAIIVRDSILNGASFEEMAKAYSTDPSAIQNKGDLGYFTVFQMVYPFETAAYNTATGMVSMPTRTKFGFHLIKVVDKKPNEGRVKVAHIMIRKGEKDKYRIFEIYDKLIAGANWDEICLQYSEDTQSAGNGGALAPFSRRQIVPAFAEAAFALTKPGEISDPVETPYGWHIIKLSEKMPVGDFDSNQYQLRTSVKRDSRAQLNKQKMIVRLAQENNWLENTENVGLVMLPESHRYLKDKWLFDKDSLANLELFKIQEDSYYAHQLYTLINKLSQQKNTKSYLFEQYKNFKNESLINYEKAHLAEKYDGYKYLKQEYHEGILLFSIMEDEVWTKAGKDSLGLAEYYEQHKSDFIDAAKLKVAIFTGSERRILDSVALKVPDSKAYKRLSKEEKETLLTQYNGTPQLSLQLDSGEFVIDQHPVLQNLSLPYKESIIYADNKWYYVLPLRNPDLPVPMAEVMGKLIVEYQVVLEDRWLIELNRAYSVNINEATLKKVYKELEKL